MGNKKEVTERYVCCLYIYLYSKLKERTNSEGIIDKHEVIKYLCWSYNLPKHISILFIEEMIKMKMIERRGKGGQYLFLKPTKLESLLDNSSKLYNYIGLW